MTEAILGLVETHTWLAALGALLWGVASVLLSPCHLTGAPLLVGFLGQLKGQALRAPLISLWVTLGSSAGLVVVAALSLAAGRILGDLWGVGPWLMIAFLLLTGLLLLGAFELPSLGRLRPERARTGATGAATAGAVLGLSLGPCTFGFFAPLLAFGAGTAPLWLKIATLGTFVLAHLASTWLAGVLGARVAGWIRRGGRAAEVAKGAVGVAAILIALEMILHQP